MHKLRWHIGCSGFSYKEWKDVFYPKGLAQGKWFAYYAQHFNTLELNVTFYRFPSLGNLQAWNQKAPDGFVFSAKVPRNITHYKKFEDTAAELSDFYAVLKEGLAQKLGCVLFQLPPGIVFNEAKLEAIIAQTNPAFKNVVEFRHESWWRPDVQERLARAGIGFCGVSFPKITVEDAITNTATAYYRFHGVPHLFHSSYNQAALLRVKDQIVSSPQVTEAFIYFNNTASTAAIANARELITLTQNS